MFEGLRKHSQSFFLVILIASLATVFGVSFGPGNKGCSTGSLRVTNIARVHGTQISEQDFRTMARLGRLTDQPDANASRQGIVNRLIERELLAYEAERMGFAVSDDELNREIRDGYFYNALGAGRVGGGLTPPTSTREWTIYANTEGRTPGTPPPAFNYEDFESWVRGVFGRTVRDYKAMMAREMLAQRVRDMVMSNVTVSDDEVWQQYNREHTVTAVRYLQFSPDFYRLVVRDDDEAALTEFARAHETQITQQWEQRRESLRGLPLQVRVRQILIRYPEGAEEPARIATVQRAQAIRDRVAAPGGDFVRMARLYSQDQTNWRSAGMSSWLAPDRVDAPPDVTREVPNLQRGQISQVIRSPLGAHIIQLVDRRQGDVTEVDAKRDIARDLFPLSRGEELAQEAAAQAQRALAAPGATLDTVANTAHAEALRAFYHGEVPAAETLPGNNTLEPVSHSDVGAPELRETQPFHAGEEVPGVENADAMVRAAFELTPERPAPDHVIEAGTDRLLIRLKENARQSASREDYARERLDQMERLLVQRRREALLQYVGRLRQEAERAGNVRIGNSPLIQERRPNERPREGADPEGAGK